MRARLLLAAVAALALAALGTLLPPVADGLRIGFLVAGAPVLGAVVLLAIGRVTGAAWQPLAALLPALPLVLVLGIAALATPVATPPHLALWLSPPLAIARGVLSMLGLGYVGWWLARGGSVTFAGVVLAVYAWTATAIGSDWLLRGAAGQPMSAAGMWLFVQQVAGACAAALLLGIGGVTLRRDLAKLLVAALIGIGYLAYMDYLIVWFGNLPHHVGFYAGRTTLLGALPVLAALVVGLAGPIGVLALRGDAGQRLAGALALVGLLLFDAWWIGGGAVALLVGAAVVGGVAALAPRPEPAHG